MEKEGHKIRIRKRRIKADVELPSGSHAKRGRADDLNKGKEKLLGLLKDVPFRRPVQLRPFAPGRKPSIISSYTVPAEGQPPERRDGFRIIGLVMSIILLLISY